MYSQGLGSGQRGVDGEEDADGASRDHPVYWGDADTGLVPGIRVIKWRDPQQIQIVALESSEALGLTGPGEFH